MMQRFLIFNLALLRELPEAVQPIVTFGFRL
jgi:hypothetical protein